MEFLCIYQNNKNKSLLVELKYNSGDENNENMTNQLNLITIPKVGKPKTKQTQHTT